MSSLQAGARSLGRGILSTARAEQQFSDHIKLGGLPRTALPSDVMKHIARNSIAGVSGVAIDYHEFRPTGSAWVKLYSPDYAPKAIDRLDHTAMTAMTLKASSASGPELSQRFRGPKGLREAIERGVVMGNGPNAGLPASSSGTNVVVYGLPERMDPDEVVAYFHGFELTGDDTRVAKIQHGIQGHRFQYLIRLASVPEAHRFVRHVHMTYFDEESWGAKYLLKAKVIY